jgi:hypothetical protein
MEIPIELLNVVNRWRKQASSVVGGEQCGGQSSFGHGGCIHYFGSFASNSAVILKSTLVPFGSSHHSMYKPGVWTGCDRKTTWLIIARSDEPAALHWNEKMLEEES